MNNTYFVFIEFKSIVKYILLQKEET